MLGRSWFVKMILRFALQGHVSNIKRISFVYDFPSLNTSLRIQTMLSLIHQGTAVIRAKMINAMWLWQLTRNSLKHSPNELITLSSHFHTELLLFSPFYRWWNRPDMGPLGNLAKIRGLVTGSTDIQTPGLKLLIPLTQIEMGSNPLYHNMGSLFGLQPGTLLLRTSVFTNSKQKIILPTLCL